LGNSLDWTYDNADFGRKASYSDLAGRTYTYEYNDFGQVVKEVSSVEYVPETVSGYALTYERATQNKYYSYYANGTLRTALTGYYVYDSGGALVEQSTRETLYEYDAEENRVAEHNADVAYMLFGIRVATNPESGEEYEILHNGQDLYATNSKYSSFDELGRLREIKAPAGSS
ncbi:hypothetical protein, partial [Halopseudomonas sp.]|uniref:hypothetical protein n=1 Tax=Halopseudomonas sp. TaxID=2901191 RepID=UPI0030021EB8